MYVCEIINMLSYKLLWCVCMYMCVITNLLSYKPPLPFVCVCVCVCVIINLLSYSPPWELRVLLQLAASLQFDLFRGSVV